MKLGNSGRWDTAVFSSAVGLHLRTQLLVAAKQGWEGMEKATGMRSMFLQPAHFFF